jgi:hypothetical protein
MYNLISTVMWQDTNKSLLAVRHALREVQLAMCCICTPLIMKVGVKVWSEAPQYRGLNPLILYDKAK